MHREKTMLASGIALVAAAAMIGITLLLSRDRAATAETTPGDTAEEEAAEPVEHVPVLDTAAYDRKMRQLAHVPEPDAADPTSDGTPSPAPDAPAPLWPADAAYPEVGALLPFNRIVAYYGNFYSTGMGILGQYAPEEVLRRLKEDAAAWEAADPTTPAVPAIDYIAVTAQRGPGTDGMYRLRMPDAQIQKAIDLANQADGIVILEVQAGLSDVMEEVRRLEPYLSLPQVHLAIDPEFAMRGRGLPGRVVGRVDAEDVNAAAAYLAALVEDHDLPPKVLVVHRYTRDMVTNADKIEPLPEVQVVMDMDGWGSPSSKIETYQAFIQSEPVQFTGFKLFYRNDMMHPGSRLLTPEEILNLAPQPSFIQYQ